MGVSVWVGGKGRGGGGAGRGEGKGWWLFWCGKVMIASELTSTYVCGWVDLESPLAIAMIYVLSNGSTAEWNSNTAVQWVDYFYCASREDVTHWDASPSTFPSLVCVCAVQHCHSPRWPQPRAARDGLGQPQRRQQGHPRGDWRGREGHRRQVRLSRSDGCTIRWWCIPTVYHYRAESCTYLWDFVCINCIVIVIHMHTYDNLNIFLFLQPWCLCCVIVTNKIKLAEKKLSKPKQGRQSKLWF